MRVGWKALSGVLLVRRLKVLLSAYACEPGKGSEPGEGWNWVRQIARFAEVWVITRANNQPVIEKALKEEPVPGVHWVYFDLPRWTRFWKQGQRGVHLYYYLWQLGAYRIGKRLHQEVGFDLVHHVTFSNYWMPSFLSLLPVCFIWGPLGGGESAPKDFYRTFFLWGKLYEYLRNLARWSGEHDPFVRLTARRAVVALAKAMETAERLQVLGVGDVRLMSAVAWPREEIERLVATPTHVGNPFRLMSIGRMLHWKGFHLGLRAFARFQQDFPESEYWFIGDGGERKKLERLAQALGVAKKVRFLGALSRQGVLSKLAEVDVLVHPSLHDSGAWVCVEAMGAGRPVICLDLGGSAVLITDETGLKVPANSPEQVIEDMAQALLRLAKDPDLRRRMGEAGRCRVREAFSWERRGEEIRKIYASVLSKWEAS